MHQDFRVILSDVNINIVVMFLYNISKMAIKR